MAEVDGPGGEEELFDLFEDLEARAESQFAAEREMEVADRAVIEYRDVTWAARLRAGEGEEVQLRIATLGALSGRLDRVGDGWLQVDSSRSRWIIPVAAVLWVRSPGSGAVPEQAVRVTQRLSFASPLRALGADETRVTAHLYDGSALEGQIGRVGADFVELVGPGTVLLRWEAVVGVQAHLESADHW